MPSEGCPSLMPLEFKEESIHGEMAMRAKQEKHLSESQTHWTFISVLNLSLYFCIVIF